MNGIIKSMCKKIDIYCDKGNNFKNILITLEKFTTFMYASTESHTLMYIFLFFTAFYIFLNYLISVIFAYRNLKKKIIFYGSHLNTRFYSFYAIYKLV